MILKAGNKNQEKSTSSGSCHLSTYLTAVYVFSMLVNEVVILAVLFCSILYTVIDLRVRHDHCKVFYICQVCS